MRSQTRNQDTQAQRAFRDTNKYAMTTPNSRFYVVYSYGPHWPLFVLDRCTMTWYENEDRCSRTTSKHRTQCHPHCFTTPLSCTALQTMINKFGQDAAAAAPSYEELFLDDVPF